MTMMPTTLMSVNTSLTVAVMLQFFRMVIVTTMKMKTSIVISIVSATKQFDDDGSCGGDGLFGSLAFVKVIKLRRCDAKPPQSHHHCYTFTCKPFVQFYCSELGSPIRRRSLATHDAAPPPTSCSQALHSSTKDQRNED